MKIMTNQPAQFNVRAKVSKERFYIDNKIVDLNYLNFLGRGASVYISLARHARHETQIAFPSYETIMRESGIKNRNTISKAIRMLEKLNMIRIRKSSRRKSNNYYMIDRSEWKSPSSITSDTTRAVSKRANYQYQKHPWSSIKSDTGNELKKSTKEMNDIEREKINEGRRNLNDKFNIHKQ